MSAASRAPSLQPVDFLHLPIGVYTLDPEGRILACNDGVRAILGLPELEIPADTRITDFHADPTRFVELTRAAVRAEDRSDGFKKAIVHFRVNGRDVFVEDYLKPRRDAAGEVDGYIGCMADITEEHEVAQRSVALQRKVEELTFDIGQILHANTSTLITVNHSLSAAAEALDHFFEGRQPLALPPIEESDELVAKRSGELADALTQLLEAGDAQRRLEALPEDVWEMLAAQVDLLRDYPQRIAVKEMHNPTLRTSSGAVANACRSIKPGLLPRERVRQVTRVALDLQRLLAFLDVVATRATVIQMDYTLRALRDFITSEVRAHESRRKHSLALLVQEAIQQLAEFARASNVTISWRERPDGLEVVGQERDLVRALANLLHNGIKYSWQRDRSKPPFVAIRMGEEDEFAWVEFETWGVPIASSEIDQGLVYNMGYRGKWSTDRGRLGTGIGLTDSQRVARMHGGDIAIESKPAQPTSLKESDAEYYKVPFLTRVRLTLPLAG